MQFFTYKRIATNTVILNFEGHDNLIVNETILMKGDSLKNKRRHEDNIKKYK